MGSRLENNSTAVRKRIEQHTFSDEQGEEYKGSAFGGFSDYFRRKKIKLQNLDAELRTQSSDIPQIFRGAVCHVNGYTQPSLNDLHRLIVSHGGGFMQYLDGKTTVTHIIAANLTPKKAVEFRRYRIVKPAWVVDSVKAGKLLPWNAYRVVDEGTGQKVLGFDDGKVVSQANLKQRGYRDQTDTSWYTTQLAKDKKPETPQLATPEARSPFRQDQTRVLDGLYEDYGGGTDVGADIGREAGFDLPDRDENTNEELSASWQQAFEQDLDDLDDDGGVRLSEHESPLPQPSPVLRQVDQPQHDMAPSISRLPSDQPSIVHGKGPNESEAVPQEQTFAQDQSAHETTEKTADYGTVSTLKRKLDTPNTSPSKKARMTAEEHNVILLSDPRIRQSSVLNPDFLEQYYRESRLHHLSTWKADLKAQLQAATAEKTSSQKLKQKRAPGARRYILHVDFDSFFVAVSLKNYPEYVDKPACVAHGSGPNSEIASCNYPARALGVKNGTWMKRAHEVCKDLKVLPYDFPAYEEASRLFYEAVIATNGIVQSVSIDEALVDVTALCLPAGGTDGTCEREGSIWREQEKADELARNLRDHVKELTGCAVSVGIGTNILLAKVALRKAKPAGQYQIKPEEVLDFLANLQVQDLPGVAYSIGGKLEEIGIKTVKDMREVSKEKLINVLGPKTGEKMWSYSRGIDRTEVGEQVIRKSVSAEINWGVRFETQEQAEEFVESLCGELSRRLLKERVKGKHLTMKIMKRAADTPLDPPKHLGHGKCDTYNKSAVLGVATNDKAILAREVMAIFRGFGFSPGDLRGLGVQMTKLEPIKAGAIGDDGSSQRRLHFTAGPSAKVPVPNDAPQPQAVEQAKPLQALHQAVPTRETVVNQKRLQFKGKSDVEQDVDGAGDQIQDDPETPRKSKALQFMPKTGATIPHIDSPGRKPLNTMGTQFIMPTQVDPRVLAELPEDIRAKLSRQMGISAELSKTGANSTNPKQFLAAAVLPNQSQLDPEILNQLPENVRAEILAQYASSPTKEKGQSRLPQSPHKNRTLPPGRQPRGRPRGSTNLLSRLKGGRTATNGNTLTQSNFTATRAPNHEPIESDGGDKAASDTNDAEIAQDYLDALPEDLRREVLAEHRAAQLKRTAGLELGRRRGAGGSRGGRTAVAAPEQVQVVAAGDGGRERVLLLAPRAARPTFTMKRLSGVRELRDAVALWYDEFRDEGPYEEDVAALCRYLKAVVEEEGDMGKAVGVVTWMGWKVGERVDGDEEGEGGTGRQWRDALMRARECVRGAVRERGLGDVEL